MKIFENEGPPLHSLYPTGSLIVDTLITDSYVIYLSDIVLSRIIRIDPSIQC